MKTTKQPVLLSRQDHSTILYHLRNQSVHNAADSQSANALQQELKRTQLPDENQLSPGMGKHRFSGTSIVSNLYILRNFNSRNIGTLSSKQKRAHTINKYFFKQKTPDKLGRSFICRERSRGKPGMTIQYYYIKSLSFNWYFSFIFRITSSIEARWSFGFQSPRSHFSSSSLICFSCRAESLLTSISLISLCLV